MYFGEEGGRSNVLGWLGLNHGAGFFCSHLVTLEWFYFASVFVAIARLSSGAVVQWWVR